MTLIVSKAIPYLEEDIQNQGFKSPSKHKPNKLDLDLPPAPKAKPTISKKSVISNANLKKASKLNDSFDIPDQGNLSDEEYSKKLQKIAEDNLTKINTINQDTLKDILNIELQDPEILDNSIDDINKLISGMNQLHSNLQKLLDFIPQENVNAGLVQKGISALEADSKILLATKDNMQTINSGNRLQQNFQQHGSTVTQISETLNSCIDKAKVKINFAIQIKLTDSLNRTFAKNAHTKDGVPFKGLFEQDTSISISDIYQNGASESLQDVSIKLTKHFQESAKTTEETIHKIKETHQKSYDNLEKIQTNNNRIIKYYEDNEKLDNVIKETQKEIEDIKKLKQNLQKEIEKKNTLQKELKELISDASKDNQPKIQSVSKDIGNSEKKINSTINNINNKSSKLSATKQEYTDIDKLHDVIDGLTSGLIKKRLIEPELQEKLISNLDESDKSLLKSVQKIGNIDLTTANTLDELEDKLKDQGSLFTQKIEQAREQIAQLPVDKLSKLKTPYHQIDDKLNKLSLTDSSIKILNTSIKELLVKSDDHKKITVDKIGIEFDQKVLSNLVDLVNNKPPAHLVNPAKESESGKPPPPPGGFGGAAPGAPPAPPLPGFKAPGAKKTISLSDLGDTDVRVVDLIIAQNKTYTTYKEQAELKQKNKLILEKVIELTSVEEIKDLYAQDKYGVAPFLDKKIKLIKSESQYQKLKQAEAKALADLINDINIDAIKNQLDTIKSDNAGNVPEEQITELLTKYDLNFLVAQKTSSLTQKSLKEAASKFGFNLKKMESALSAHLSKNDLPGDVLEQAKKQATTSKTSKNLVSATGLKDLVYENQNHLDTETNDNKNANSNPKIAEIGKAVLKGIKASEGTIKEKAKFKITPKSKSKKNEAAENSLEKELIEDIKEIKVKELFAKQKFNQEEQKKKKTLIEQKVDFIKENAASIFNDISKISSNLDKVEIRQSIKKILIDFGHDIFDVAKYDDNDNFSFEELNNILNLGGKFSTDKIPGRMQEIGLEEFTKNFITANSEDVFSSKIPLSDFNESDAYKDFWNEALQTTLDKYKKPSLDSVINDLSKDKDDVVKQIKKAKVQEFLASIKSEENSELLETLIHDAGGSIAFFDQLVSKDESLTDKLSKLDSGEFVNIFVNQLALKWGLQNNMMDDLLKVNKDGARARLDKIQQLDEEKKQLIHEVNEPTVHEFKNTDDNEFKDHPQIKIIDEKIQNIKEAFDKTSNSVTECLKLNVIDEIYALLEVINGSDSVNELKKHELKLNVHIQKFIEHYVSYVVRDKDNIFVKTNKNLASYTEQKNELEQQLSSISILYENQSNTPEDKKLYSALIKKYSTSLEEINAHANPEDIQKAKTFTKNFRALDQILDEKLSGFVVNIKQLFKMDNTDEINTELAKMYIKDTSSLKETGDYLIDIFKKAYVESKTNDAKQIKKLFTSDEFNEYKNSFSVVKASQNKFISDQNFQKLLDDQTGYAETILKTVSKVNLDLNAIMHTKFATTLLGSIKTDYAKGMQKAFDEMPKLTMKQYEITDDLTYVEGYFNHLSGILFKLTSANCNIFNQVADKIEQSFARFANDNLDIDFLKKDGDLNELLNHKAFKSLNPVFVPLHGPGIPVPPPLPGSSPGLPNIPNPPPNLSVPGAPPPPPGRPTPILKSGKLTNTTTGNSKDNQEKNNKRLEDFKTFSQKLKNFVTSNIKNKHQESDIIKQYKDLIEKIDAEYFGNKYINNALENMKQESEYDLINNFDMAFSMNKADLFTEYFNVIDQQFKKESPKKLSNILKNSLGNIQRTEIEKLKTQKNIEECKNKYDKLQKTIKSFPDKFTEPDTTYEDIEEGYSIITQNINEFKSEVELMLKGELETSANESGAIAEESYLEQKIKEKDAEFQEKIKEAFAILEDKLTPNISNNKGFVSEIVNNFGNKKLQEQISLIVETSSKEKPSQTILYKLLHAVDPKVKMKVGIEFKSILSGRAPGDLENSEDIEPADEILIEDIAKLFLFEGDIPDYGADHEILGQVDDIASKYAAPLQK